MENIDIFKFKTYYDYNFDNIESDQFIDLFHKYLTFDNSNQAFNYDSSLVEMSLNENEESFCEIVGEIRYDTNPLPIPKPTPHADGPISLILNEAQILQGAWLTDYDIFQFLRLLKTQFPHVNGLELPCHYTVPNRYIENKTTDFIRIVNCNNNHWICIAGELFIQNEDICFFDSMRRESINKNLGDQLSKMMPKKSNEQKIIKITIMKNQIQKKALCGYFACAFATALCFNVDIEKLIFTESFLTSHWIHCIKEKKASMFPHIINISANNSLRTSLTFTRT